MKIRSLFLGALVIGSLISCSKDDDGPDTPVYQQIDTYLSISTTANSGTITKGTVEPGKSEIGDVKERKIHTLTAVVFYDDEVGALAAIKKVTDPEQNDLGETSIEDVVVKVAATEAGQVSDTKLKIFLLANVTVPADKVKDYRTFIGSSFSGIADCSFSGVMADEQEKYIPMSSSKLNVTKLIAGTSYNNWVETSGETPIYTSNKTSGNEKKLIEQSGKYVEGTEVYTVGKRISLVRYVARVQLESLNVDFGNNYENAVFTLTNVSAANVSNASLYYAENEGSLQSVDYTSSAAFLRGYPVEIDRADYYLARGSYDGDTFSKVYGTINGDGSVSNGISLSMKGMQSIQFDDQTTDDSEGTSPMAQFYVFEFNHISTTPDEGGVEMPSTATPNINTMLIITGLWDNGPIKEERSFRIPIRHSNDSEDYQVKRNYIYKVHATLTGEGTNNPDKSMLNACVSFSVQVKPWKVIKQTETDIN